MVKPVRPAKLAIQIKKKPPTTAQISAARQRLELACKFTVSIGGGTLLAFLILYATDTPPTGKEARLAAARVVDYWMAGLVAFTLLMAILHTKFQFGIQLLQPITEQGLQALRALGVAHPTLARYLSQVDKEGREVIEAESKLGLLYADGQTEVVEYI